MTDRIRHLTVILEQDTREDDLEATLAAIAQIRGVDKVIPHVVQAEDRIALCVATRSLYRRVQLAVADAFEDKAVSR